MATELATATMPTKLRVETPKQPLRKPSRASSFYAAVEELSGEMVPKYGKFGWVENGGSL